MTKHMQVREIGAPHGGGAVFSPTTVNFTANVTFWLSVKHKRLLFFQKTLYFTDMPHPCLKERFIHIYKLQQIFPHLYSF